MEIIKIVYAIASISFVALFFSLDRITSYLKDKPKDNRLRRLWSRHVVDLDDIYK